MNQQVNAKPNFDDVVHAASTIEGQAVCTPIIRSKVLNDRTGADVWIKPECLQRTGSFKFRGAFNAVSKIAEQKSAAGVVACSSGNHAQGVAAAAGIFNLPAIIVMPSDAPALKLSRTRDLGAKVVTYDRENEDRDEIAKSICDETDSAFVHPYDNSDVIAGQGTVGLELCRELQQSDKQLDRILICCGGGGLTSGVALATKHHFPSAIIHPVEPIEFDDYGRSLVAGERLLNSKKSGSICDAILTPSPGRISFSILQDCNANGLSVSDDDVRDAMRFAFEELKLVVEPGGSVALAALLKAGREFGGETIGVIISGGNVDAELFSNIISQK